MESIFTRYRNVIVLLAILAVQIVGLAVQVRRTDGGRRTFDSKDPAGVRLVRLWAEALMAPPERMVQGTKIGTIHVWQDYVDLRNVREQNRNLQETIDRLRLEQASLLEDAEQGHRLQELNGFQHRYIYSTLAAQAIGSSGSDQSRIYYLDKGSNAGVKPDMAVITADGIVGKVREVGPTTAQVLAINDQMSGAGVILETTRIRGILTGNALGQLEVIRISADERIKPGERVLTAGGDLVFPRGLPVGEVQKVVRDPDHDGLIIVIVKPVAHLDRLDEVMVITNTQPRFSAEQQQDLAMSESVKGAEAAEIKDQLKASQIMAERLPGLIDPNLPPEQQPLLDNSNPNPVAHPPQALHPDRFSPVTDAPANPAANSGGKPAEQEKPKTANPQVGPQTRGPQTAAPRTGVPPAAKPKGNP